MGGHVGIRNIGRAIDPDAEQQNDGHRGHLRREIRADPEDEEGVHEQDGEDDEGGLNGGEGGDGLAQEPFGVFALGLREAREKGGAEGVGQIGEALGEIEGHGVGGNGGDAETGADDEAIDDGEQGNDGTGDAHPAAKAQEWADLCAMQGGPAHKGQLAGGEPEHDDYSRDTPGEGGGDERGDAAMPEGDADEREGLETEDADDLAGIEGEEGLTGFKGTRQDGDEGDQGDDGGKPGNGLLGLASQRGRDLKYLRKEPVSEEIEDDPAQYAHARAEKEGGPEGAVAFLGAFLTGNPLRHGPTQPEVKGAKIAEQGEGEEQDAITDFTNPA